VIIDTILGKKKTPEELVREYKRSLNRSIRQLDRERNRVMMQEKQLMNEMKMLAKKNQMDAVKIKAKDLIRNRKASEKFLHMKAQMQGLIVRLQIMNSSSKMIKAMAGCTKTMKKMNASFKSEDIQKIAMEFKMQGALQEEMQEVLDEALDDVMNDDDADEEEDALVNQILDSVNLDIKQTTETDPVPAPQQSGGLSVEERFARLRDPK